MRKVKMIVKIKYWYLRTFRGYEKFNQCALHYYITMLKENDMECDVFFYGDKEFCLVGPTKLKGK